MGSLFIDFQTNPFEAVMASPLFAITVSLAAFQLGNFFYRRFNHFSLLHPTLSGAVIATIVLTTLDIDYRSYVEGNHLLMFWLGPATVALAVPLYQQLHLIRKMALPILFTFSSGAFFAAASAVTIGWLMGASTTTLLSLAPKSVTTPIAMSLAEEIGGLSTLTAGCVAITAVIGIGFAPIIYRVLGIKDPKIQGFCLGITAHGMGTAKAFETHPTAGAFASLAMCLTGAFSALLIPVAANVISQW